MSAGELKLFNCARISLTRDPFCGGGEYVSSGGSQSSSKVHPKAPVEVSKWMKIATGRRKRPFPEMRVRRLELREAWLCLRLGQQAEHRRCCLIALRIAIPLQQTEKRRCYLLPQPRVKHGSAWRFGQQAEQRCCCLIALRLAIPLQQTEKRR